MAIGAAGGNDAQGAGRMNLSAINDLSWIGIPPNDWKVSRVKSIFHQDTTKISVANLAELEVEHYSIPAFDEYRAPVNENGTTIASDKTLLRGGELLFSKLNSHKPRVWIIPIDEKTKVASTEFVALRAWFNERTNLAFLSYLLGSEVFASYISCFQTSVTNSHKRINPEDLLRTVIPLPPLPEQIRIAAYLDASCAAIDAAVNAKKKQLEALIEMKNETLHRAFNHAEWPVERVKDLAIKIGSGVTPDGGSAGSLDEGIPLLRSQNVHFDGLRLDDVAFIAPETHREMRNSQLKPHDVLLNITGASIGRCSYVPDDFGEGNVNQHVCIIRSGHRLHYRFLAEYLSSPMGQGQIMSTFTGASRQGLSHKDLGLIRIPAPSIETQCEVVASLNTAEEQRSKLFSNIESQIATLIDYRKSLIHECVTGQRRISETDVAKVERTLEQAAGLPQQ